jgi:hypothetical protein
MNSVKECRTANISYPQKLHSQHFTPGQINQNLCLTGMVVIHPQIQVEPPLINLLFR